MRKMFRHAKRKTQGTLVTLRAKRPRKAYKSDENYLRAVYRNNKEWLNSHKTYTPSVSLERSFVNSAMEYISQGYTAVQAANKLASSGAFTGKSYRGKVNIYNVILNDKKLYEKFKKETNIKRKEDFEVEKLEWSYREDAYKYGDVYISVSNSPYRIDIYNPKNVLEEVTESVFD